MDKPAAGTGWGVEEGEGCGPGMAVVGTTEEAREDVGETDG